MKTTDEPKPQTVLFIVCGWCKKQMGTKDGKGTTGVSHSICPECAEKTFKRGGVKEK